MAAPLRIDELTTSGSVTAGALMVLVQGGATVQRSLERIIAEAPVISDSASSSSATSILQEFRRTVWAERFGFHPSNTAAVNTLALQAAINSLPTATPNPGGVVKIGVGVFSINEVTIPDQVILEGQAFGAAQTDEQGATLFSVGGAFGLTSSATFGVGIKNIAIKNATTACIKFTDVQHWILDEVQCLGTSVPTGIHITGTSYFGLIKQPNIAGLAGAGAVGIKINGGANENTIFGGCVRQNTTDVEINDANNIRIIGVDMEGGAGQTSVSLAPTSAADAMVIGCRFEGNTNGIVCGTNATHLTAIGNWYACTNGVVDNSSNHRMGIFEPHLYTATTPGVLSWQLHDANSTGMQIGSTTIKNISGGNNLVAGSGKLLLTTSGGNPVQLDANAPMDIAENHILMSEIGDPSAPASNKAILYTKDNGAGKTQLVARFPTGAVQVIATEP